MFLVDKQIASTRAECVKGDTCQGRPTVRIPSVPVDSSQPPSQQVSCVYNGFDLSITSFPRIYLSPDGNRLCHSIAESIPSVPPVSHASTLQTHVGVQKHRILPPRQSYRSYTTHNEKRLFQESSQYRVNLNPMYGIIMQQS